MAAATPLSITSERSEISKLATASPLSITPERVVDDSKKRPFPCVQPDSDDEEDWDEKASLNICVHDSTEYSGPFLGIFNPLMEVSSVIINYLTMAEDQLYGDIRIYGGTDYGVVLFHREKSSDEITTFTNDGKTELLLTGPAGSIIMLADRLQVTMTFIGRNNESYSKFIPFNPIGYTRYTIYGKLISATIEHAAFGSITVNYKVFPHSVAAKVDVILLDAISTSIDDVFGGIYAYNSEDKLKSCLFYKKSKTNGAPVSPLTPSSIPLSRSIVAVPCHADLMLDLDLKDSNTGLSIVKTEALTFNVPDMLRLKKRPEPMTRIPQQKKSGGKILIEVTWALCYDLD